MGLLRLILALAVVSAHTNRLYPFHTLYGFFAVKVFFVISGFYMALILNEKYFMTPNYYKNFIVNRIFRLYPLYLLVFIMSLLLFLYCWLDGTEFYHQRLLFLHNPIAILFGQMDILSKDWVSCIYLVVTNLFIVGLDWAPFVYSNAVQVITQGWTLSLEFYFYFMAPYLVRIKSIRLVTLIVIGAGLRLWLTHFGFAGDKWLYRFFPFEIVFFLLGIISYRLYKRLESFKVSKIAFAVALMVILAPILNWKIVQWTQANCVSLFCLQFALIVILLPIIFSYTRNNKLDRWIGEFSYPIYLVHLSVSYFIQWKFALSSADAMFGWTVALVSFVLSLALLYFFIYPIEKMRSSRALV